MLTVADIEGQTLAPLSDLVAAADVPGDLAGFAEDAGDLLAGCRFTDATFQPVENGFLGDVVLVLDRESRSRRSGTPSSFCWLRPAT